MKEFSPTKIVLLCLAFFLFAFFISNRLFRGDPSGWKQTITSDGRGYYAYLPAFLIYHDLTYKQVVEKERMFLRIPDYQPRYLVKAGNRAVNKYFAGEALLLLPFFLIAMLLSFIGGFPLDGYSFYFQIMIGLGAIIYLLLGLRYLKKVMLSFDVRETVAGIVILTIFLGTNLFYYTIWQPSMSHVFSFFAINGFLWHAIKSIRGFNLKNTAVTGIFLGLVLLIRPSNVVVLLLVPFLFTDYAEMKAAVGSTVKNPKPALLMAAMLLLVISIQVIAWYLQSGRLALWSYKDEGFYFTQPQIFNVLFSFRKGLFIYTPLIFLSLFGLIVLFRQPLKLASMAIFLLASTYIVASWWNWYYGDSFGLRAFIDYYGIFALLIALFLNRFTFKGSNTVMIAIFLPFIGLNIFQTWQYTNWIIQPNSMNHEKYSYIFLKSDSAYINCLGGNDELPPYSVDLTHPCRSIMNHFEKQEPDWSWAELKRIPNLVSGKYANIVDSAHPFSSGFMVRADRISSLPATYYLESTMMVYDSVPGASNAAMLVFSMDSINFRDNYWYGIPLNDIPENLPRTWRRCRFSITLPRILNPDGILKIYVWTTGRKPFFIDDFRLTFFLDKPESIL